MRTKVNEGYWPGSTAENEVPKKGRDKMTDQMNCLLVTYHFQEGTKELLRSLLEFFINYGLELGE